MESSFGEIIKVSISGGSHEPSVCVSVTGLPQDFVPDMDTLQAFLDRRAPGKSSLASSRKEADIPVLKYRSDGKMVFEIANTDHRSSDYDKFRNVPRPGHADYTARLRYGTDFDMAGGGPFSGRMTAPLCVAGGLALQVLANRDITISANLISAGGSTDAKEAIAEARDQGDSVGGIVQCIAEGVPAGIGDAMYGGLESRLAPILFGIPAVKGVDFGAGFRAAGMRGSENNDPYYCESYVCRSDNETEHDKTVLPVLKTRTNNCGGILGGITTGMPVTCRVAFKPTPSISIPQESVNLLTGEPAEISVTGRHDPCVALRAVPAVEAALALGLLDAIMVTESATAGHYGQATISDLRKGIDDIDSQILRLFEARMKLASEIGALKKTENIPVQNVSREEEIIDRIRSEADPAFAPYAENLFRKMFSLSRALQNTEMESDEYGLIGHPLHHSFSCQVHRAFGAYGYSLFDLNLEEMKAFVSSRKFRGLSVTRPYKQAVIPLCDRLTDRAKAIGAVNTLYWEGSELIGHNTDYDGFLYTAKRSGIDFADKCILILGTGGTSKTVDYAVRDRGARQVYFASRKAVQQQVDRSCCDACVFSYEDLPSIAEETDIIVNTTPLGTYPDNLEGIVSLRDFPNCQAVIDVIYNPSMTPLLLEARELCLKWANGMPMIVAQAAAAAERFTGKEGAFMGMVEDVLDGIDSSSENIVLIGMPGCGKSTAGRLLAQATGRTFVDLDETVAAADGRSVPEIIATDGEAEFRRLESAAAEKHGAEHGQIIATGGGIVLDSRNYMALKQNGFIIWLTRPLEELPLEGRPLSENRSALNRLYEERSELYKKWADCTVDSAALLKILS